MEIKNKANKILNFLKKVSQEVYSEPDTQMHMSMIDKIVPDLEKNQIGDNKDQSILDVGCGQGYAMTKFKEAGFTNIQGITMSDEDVKATQDKGFKCEKMDQSFMTFEDESFDFLFVRHCLEHSPFPYLTLGEFHRVLKMGGKIYIEMPAPDNVRPLEYIANHYSVMGAKQWAALMLRYKFQIQVATDYTVELFDGKEPDKKIPEKNLVFVIKKVTDEEFKQLAIAENTAQKQDQSEKK
jgi:ubiquinone/menaquinone biosynthesis C-methylase UbiE|tara:strand:- start:2962 stop:3678 length:717 start_codon:yes stop_codon:yes gene_type:complete